MIGAQRDENPQVAATSIRRQPLAALRPFVAYLWASATTNASCTSAIRREHLLPSGATHLVFRLGTEPLWISDSSAQPPQRLTGALIGGVRTRFYVRESAVLSASVGAVLRSGAARSLFGVAAHELAGRHTCLNELWGSDADNLHERLVLAPTAQARLHILEVALLARLPPVHALHPGIAAALAILPTFASVHAAVAASGMSHRQFIERFRESVGIAPKACLRVLRLHAAARALREGGTPLAAVAADAGFSDQSHLTREFVELTGLTPLAYWHQAGGDGLHVSVPVDEPRARYRKNLQDARRFDGYAESRFMQQESGRDD
ncbi:Transcriptional regulator, AraC family [Thiomonas sp. X19]|uniref:helix-turn-helix transcriptional regulator n=1 Tax=Thiomonas sp. X19 TaxID=1050370 RepID=UPI000B663402|nr:helix-turn-helix transcriptional regulator [Thiomonas sp. X19]SCC91752.1 Transcriptional regulator, AraC family [Thiomonas sp. X19]